MSTPDRVVFWRRLDIPGGEYCALGGGEDGWELRGTAVAVMDGMPLAATYVVACDAGWRTRRVEVSLQDGAGTRSLVLTVDAARRWWRDGREIAAVRGCVDVDLGISPSTNTLPLRRLGVDRTGVAHLTAAWVRFPELTVEPLDQRYTPLGPGRCRYESLVGDEVVYEAELTLDDRDMVVRYAGVWVRETVAT